jgi:hypothetical protein
MRCSRRISLATFQSGSKSLVPSSFIRQVKSKPATPLFILDPISKMRFRNLSSMTSQKQKNESLGAGYSVWKYSPTELSRLFGHEYSGLTTLEQGKTDAEGRPRVFFATSSTKGETFSKFGDFVKLDPSVWRSESEFRAGFEQVKLVPSQNLEHRKGTKILAETRHSLTGEKIPYVVQKENRFYFADVPFSYMHESDRMLVFADLLFDILDEKPRHNGKYAVVRIEDIHPMIPLFEMDDILRVLREEKVPVTISLIPLFFDPLFRAGSPGGRRACNYGSACRLYGHDPPTAKREGYIHLARSHPTNMGDNRIHTMVFLDQTLNSGMPLTTDQLKRTRPLGHWIV